MSEGKILGAEFADVSEYDIARLCKVGELYFAFSQEASPQVPPLFDDALRNAKHALALAQRIQQRRVESGDTSGNFSGRVPIVWPENEILEIARDLDRYGEADLPLTFI